jgi:hypothetical protein
MTHRFVTSSAHALDEDILEMLHSPLRKVLKPRYFIDIVAAKIGILRDVLGMFGHETKMMFWQDPSTSCASSYYQGIPCYFISKDGNEYLYVEAENFDFVLSTDNAKARQRVILSLKGEFRNLQIERAPENDKSFYALAGEFHNQNRALLSEYRIPLSSLSSPDFDHAKALSIYDRTYYGIEARDWHDLKKNAFLSRQW